MARQISVLLYIYAAVFITGTFAGWEEDFTAILNDGNNKDFLNKINKLRDNFQQYNFDVDRAIPWKELKASMEALDLLRINYNGRATNDLIEVQETTATLMNEYRLVTNELFRWAVTGKARFDLVVKKKDVLKNIATVKQFVEDTLNKGDNIMTETADKLNSISSRLILLESKLKRIKSMVMAELEELNEAFAEYEAHRTEFNNNLASDLVRAETELQECESRRTMASEMMKKSNMVSWIIAGVGALVTAILTIAIGPAGTTLGIGLTGTAIEIQKQAMTPQNVSCAKIKGDFENLKLTQPLPSEEANKKIVNEFYTALGNAIENAIRNVTKVKTAINAEVSYIEIMRGKVEEMVNRSSIILDIQLELYNELVIDDLHNISVSLGDYVKRHSGGIQFAAFVGHTRNRRGLRSIAQFQMEYARMNKKIEDQLNATEFDRNERFWNLDNAGIQMESMLQIEPFLKFGM